MQDSNNAFAPGFLAWRALAIEDAGQVREETRGLFEFEFDGQPSELHFPEERMGVQRQVDGILLCGDEDVDVTGAGHVGEALELDGFVEVVIAERPTKGDVEP